MLHNHAAVAERLGYTKPDVLSRPLFFRKGAGRFAVPANYGPLDESVRLSALTRCRIMKPKDEYSHALSAKMDVGECWYMDWTRKFDESLNRNKYGLVFVNSKTWLLRARFFKEKLAERPAEGTRRLRNFVRRKLATTCSRPTVTPTRLGRCLCGVAISTQPLSTST